jgi:hypothetical protein
MRIEALPDVSREDADELHDDRAAGPAAGHCEHGTAVCGHRLARRRVDRSR